MMFRRKNKVVLLALGGLLFAGAGAWAVFDLWGPRSTSLRQFNPDEVARLETEMWRSYYDRERLRLFNELSVLLRHQYHMPFLRSYVVAFHAAKAAFIFKDGSSRAAYERALPDLIDYYAAIRKVSEDNFDVTKAAKLELEWWIIHRQRGSHAPGDLDASLQALAAEIYQMPVERFRDHARYRAEAMLLRDRLSEQTGVSDPDWQRIHGLLLQSWNSLWHAVNE